MSSAGGRVARYSLGSVLAQPNGFAPDVQVDGHGTMTTLAAASDGSDSGLVAVGSWFPSDEGDTLHLLDAMSLDVLLALDAGPVLGVALVDLDRDGLHEILVGTQDGWLRAYDQAGAEVLAWSAGDASVGENGALYAVRLEDETVVAVAVAGGWRVLSIVP